ncbi:MAG: hypothetical protein OHK93_005318 [Ramalina farinacea]|uniref:Uncharacterized protein n=1 Tax=Ramalina farinacea TaxID=258253 RepID=A0AA43QVU5_9LECA|nr:hypothetical protein [Ramalina farinacea]
MRQFSGWQLYVSLLAFFFSSAASADDDQYIPWSWRVQPDARSDMEGTCPSAVQILGTFAFVNVVVSVISLIAGNSKVIKSLTCGFCGSESDSETWFYMFLFPLATNLGANALIAYLYKTTPGFGDTFTIGDLILFFTTRPRLSWIVLVVFMNLDTVRNKDTRYSKSAKSAVAAEVFLQFISSYYMGWTANFAARNGYYSHPERASDDARIMYAGALLALISLIFTIGSLIYILFVDAELDTTFAAIITIGCTSWLASWLFWGGYVGLSQNS